MKAETSQVRTWRVGELLLAASDALQSRLGAVAVRGELSGFSRAASGHCYFTLKDDAGQAALLRCAMFRRAAGLLDFRPADGQQVELRGRISVYEARGELQCVVESMQRVGAGSLYEQFLRLKAKLELAGLFDTSRKREIEAFPSRIGIVTSLGAAALHDVLSAIARRAPQVAVVVYPSAVQGAEAPAQLVRAIELAGQRAEVQTLIVCRGGGSLEDLWAFNDEQVVRAIAACPIPVICGVGHETDLTLAELAADLRAPTPTAAAELAAPRRDEALARLQALSGTLDRAVHRRLDGWAQRLDLLSLQLGRPARLVAQQSARLAQWQGRMQLAVQHAGQVRRLALDDLGRRLTRAAQRFLQAQAQGLRQAELRLQAGDPHRVLARGYAWLTDDHDRPVSTVRALQRGQRLTAQWADGKAQVDVVDIVPGDDPR
ncbi:MAG: exodeoxyribonuclease VII large subunit [Burkholderiales bacterium]|nr:exodeoxyribonuclease VII large subunit [Burkholderiales bacterium]